MTKHLRLKGLYAITDQALTPHQQLHLKVEQALKGGARIIQYRDKSKDNTKRLLEARLIKQLCDEYNATLLINDDIDLCIAAEAHGVHLGREDTGILAARQQLAAHHIIGATCHGEPDAAWQAIEQGADYVAFGRFYPSNTKPNAKPADLTLIEPVLKRLPVPAVAIGGITLDNAPPLIAAGFNMLAVVHSLFGHEDTLQRSQAFSQLFSTDY